MKSKPFLKAIGCLSILTITIALTQCDSRSNDTYQRLRQHCDQLKVINTHEHQRWPEENGDLSYGFFHLLASSYLMADVVSAGGSWLALEEIDTMDHNSLWDWAGEALDHTRNTSYYGHFIRGFQQLYDFRDPYFTKENTLALSSGIAENYADYRTWFDQAFQKAGFELMFLDQYWKPLNTAIDEKHFALAFHINTLVMQASSRPGEEGEPEGIYALAEKEGMAISSLEDYLEICDDLFRKNVENRAVCVKNSMAYSRSLDYEDIPFETASDLFLKPSENLSNEEKKMIQDFMFHWVIQKSIEHDLPIQIHTGYLAGNGNVLDNGRPLKLNKLFLKYPEANFILFHGGYPWTGEYAAFGKMFPNVYLDLVWLPQISREEAVHALEEILDGVPYNKLFWGGDCAFIEETTGSLEFGKDVVATVLNMRIQRGLLSEEVGMEIIDRIFRENAIEVFKLEERLGRKFRHLQEDYAFYDPARPAT